MTPPLDTDSTSKPWVRLPAALHLCGVLSLLLGSCQDKRREGGLDQWIMRIAVAEVLTKAFRIQGAAFAAALSRPFGHAIQVLIHAVVLAEPVSLGFVPGQHLALGLHPARDVHVELRMDSVTHRIDAFHRIRIIERGSRVPWRCRRICARLIEAYRNGE